MLQGLGTNKKTSIYSKDYATIMRIKNDDKLQQAESYDRKLKYVGVNVDWYESQQKFESKNKKKLNDTRIKKELMLTMDEIKMRRRERLSQLYFVESDLFEQELADKGLAIVKERY